MSYQEDVIYDLIGLGIGLFNLSVAALAEPLDHVKCLFLDKKPEFSWHPELIMPEATMQTSFLKDLVTGVDPTSQYSFLNFLLHKQRLYAFLNTDQQCVQRKEFDEYGKWVASQLTSLCFNMTVKSVEFIQGLFHIHTDSSTFKSKHICVGTGPQLKVPDCAEMFIGETCFHPKSSFVKDIDATGKRLTVIGGGQTGAEIFYNLITHKLGVPREVVFVSRRFNLEALDETSFVNEFFTPDYVSQFRQLDGEMREKIVEKQKLTSDGITPKFLKELYQELYNYHYVEKDQRTKIRILTNRALVHMEKHQDLYGLTLLNQLNDSRETFDTDIVVLATGFTNTLPPILDSIKDYLPIMDRGGLHLNHDFTVPWEFDHSNHIFALNFGRYSMGISEPQTSLMAWRSAKILNTLLGEKKYNTSMNEKCFVNYV